MQAVCDYYRGLRGSGRTTRLLLQAAATLFDRNCGTLLIVAHTHSYGKDLTDRLEQIMDAAGIRLREGQRLLTMTPKDMRDGRHVGLPYLKVVWDHYAADHYAGGLGNR